MTRKAKRLTDYILTMRDGSGRTCKLYITADCITDLVAHGYKQSEATEAVQDNAFQNAIARGEIGADAWLV